MPKSTATLGRWLALALLATCLPALIAGGILKKHHADKARLMESSKLTIGIQAMVSLVLIASVLL